MLEDDGHEYHGVCAHELERKLHELLEMRQQEKIAELESALERAEKNLREKEIELELGSVHLVEFTFFTKLFLILGEIN